MLSLLKLLALGLLPLQAALAADPIQAQRADDKPDGPGEAGGSPSGSPPLNVKVSASFPESEIFGIKLVNGQETTAVVSVANNEPTDVQVRFIGGSLWTPGFPGQPARVVRNLSTTVYDGSVAPGQSEKYNYKIKTELHPQDLRLTLAAVLTGGPDKAVFTIPAYNETVSIVEAPTSIFDPQIIFLYLVVAAVFGGVSYFIYTTWISTLFPQQKKRGGKGGDRSRSKGAKKTDPASPTGDAAGPDSPAITTGSSKGYDASWIPAHHLQRPEAKRVRSGTPTGVKTKPRPA